MTSFLRPARDIPLARPFLNGRELELLGQVLEDGLDPGCAVERFERAFAEAVGARDAVAVSSPTAALQLAGATAGWGPGDEIVTTPFGAVAAAAVARVTGAMVVLVDIDERTLGVDVDAVGAAITSRTRGIVAVDSFGWSVDAARLAPVADAHDLVVVEDASDVLEPAPAPWSRMFELGIDAAVTCGGGAIICTDSPAQADAWRQLAAHAELDCAMHDLQAAVGIAQVEKLQRIQALRAMVAREYERMLARVPGATLPPPEVGRRRRAATRCWVLVDEQAERDGVVAAMRRAGIDARAPRATIEIPPAIGRRDVRAGDLSRSRAVLDRAVELPCHPQLSPGQQERVVEALRDALASQS